MSDTLLAQVRKTVTGHQLLPPRERVVVAVSGGPDSVALLHILVQLNATWKLTIHVAHLDHGLREDSVDDADFVRALSTQWHLPVTMARRDVKAQCQHAGWSLEDGARRIRYQFLLEVARQQSASRIVLAHTADDQAETVLMRILRGTGLLGLSGIPIRRRLADAAGEGAGVWVVRPLLFVWREQLVDYLRQHGLTSREDPTNRDPHFVRNRLRHALLPLLEREYNPSVKRALVQLAEQSAWDTGYLEAAAARIWKRLGKVVSGSEVAIAVPTFLRQPQALQRQLLRHTIARMRGSLEPFEFRHWLEAQRLFTERPVGTLLDLPGGMQLRREPDRVICRLQDAASCSTLEPVS